MWRFAYKNASSNFTGDGTVGWVLEALRKRESKTETAILPLGTGNDLARTLGWGGGYAGESIYEILQEIVLAKVVKVDRYTHKLLR